MNRHAPWPSCQITFRRSPLRPRKQKRWPLKGLRFRTSWTCKAKEGNPFRMSVWPVASNTRTPLGGIIADQERQELDPTHRHPPSGQPERSVRREVDFNQPAGVAGSPRTSLTPSGHTAAHRPLRIRFADRDRDKSRFRPAAPRRPSRACRRQLNKRLFAISRRRATSQTTVPGPKLSSTIRILSSCRQRRRPFGTQNLNLHRPHAFNHARRPPPGSAGFRLPTSSA